MGKLLYDVLLVSTTNNLVRAILARDLESTDAWATVEEYGAKLDTANAFVLDDTAGQNQVGAPYRGFLSEFARGFKQQ